MDWLAGDLPSWLAVFLAIGAALVAWRFARSASYVEFHPDWNIHIDDESGDTEVRIRVTIVTIAAYLGGRGKLSFGKKAQDIRLVFKKQEPNMLRAHESLLTFTGHYDGGPITKRMQGQLELKLHLSDGKTKRLKGSVEVNPESSPDKEGSPP